jgi:hypothetical protein
MLHLAGQILFYAHRQPSSIKWRETPFIPTLPPSSSAMAETQHQTTLDSGLSLVPLPLVLSSLRDWNEECCKKNCTKLVIPPHTYNTGMGASGATSNNTWEQQLEWEWQDQQTALSPTPLTQVRTSIVPQIDTVPVPVPGVEPDPEPYTVPSSK